MADLPKIEDLLISGAHLGHQKGRWNPKMEPYISSIKNNVHIINLEKTLEGLEKAQNFIKDLLKENKTILFVGSKRQAKEAIKKTAMALKMPYIDYRWLGGTLTNFETIQKALATYNKLNANKTDKEFMGEMTKKEQKNFMVKLEKMEKSFGGIVGMTKHPDAVFIIDTNEEKVAVAESMKFDIPIVATVDTNSDPSKIDYIIPMNDDSRSTINLVMDSIVKNCQKVKVSTKLQK
jgi:small subunit ribosomal protein S2